MLITPDRLAVVTGGVLGALSLFLGLPSARLQAKELKIGFVQMQRIILAVDEGKKARSLLERDFKSKKTELEDKEEELKRKKADLEQQSMILSPEALHRKEEDYKKTLVDFQKLYASHQRDIQDTEMKLTAKIVEKVKEIIDKVAKVDGYDFVFEKSDNVMLLGPEDCDLTDKVVSAYNQAKSDSSSAKN